MTPIFGLAISAEFLKRLTNLQYPCQDTTEPSCDHKCTEVAHLVQIRNNCHTGEISCENKDIRSMSFY